MAKENFGALLLLFQIILIILFIVFFDGTENFTSNRELASNERRVFMNVHIYTFLGFGLNLTFLKRYSRGMLVHSLLIGGVVIQWATLLQVLFTTHSTNINLSLMRIMNADFAVIAVLISVGAIMGKCNSLQLLVLAVLETIFFAGNEAICLHFLKMADFGRSVIVHAFGAFFGLGVSWMIYSRRICSSKALSTSRKTEMYSLIGTLFLWTYWPSVNGAYVDISLQSQVMMNTIYSLISSCVTSAALTIMYSKEWKFNILHLQNATLAGGIAISSIAALRLTPWSAMFVGICGSIGSILTYVHILPKLRHNFRVHDTRGIFPTHGIPGVISGIASIITAYLANEKQYGVKLYELYPARTPRYNTTKYLELNKISSISAGNGRSAISAGNDRSAISAGNDRSAITQSYIQLASIIISLFTAVIGGIITGYVIGMDYFEPVRVEQAFDDHDDFEEKNCIDVIPRADDGTETIRVEIMREKGRGSSFSPLQGQSNSMYGKCHTLTLQGDKRNILSNGFSLPNFNGHIPLEDLRRDKKRGSTFLSVKSYHGHPFHDNKPNTNMAAVSQQNVERYGKTVNYSAIPQIVITDVDDKDIQVNAV